MKSMTASVNRMINTAIVYFACGCVAGVFYREFTKAVGYTGPTNLKVMHTHLFALGMLLFLILALFCQNNPKLADSRSFTAFYVIYNISLPIMVLCLFARGMFTVEHTQISHALDMSISGIAGLSHIGLAVALILLFVAMKRRMPNDQQNTDEQADAKN